MLRCFFVLWFIVMYRYYRCIMCFSASWFTLIYNLRIIGMLFLLSKIKIMIIIIIYLPWSQSNHRHYTTKQFYHQYRYQAYHQPKKSYKTTTFLSPNNIRPHQLHCGRIRTFIVYLSLHHNQAMPTDVIQLNFVNITFTVLYQMYTLFLRYLA